VDSKLIRLARNLGAKLFTNDYNLSQIAELQKVPYVNLHDLAGRCREKCGIIPAEITNRRPNRQTGPQ
jgi:uncharacterized protein YacL